MVAWLPAACKASLTNRQKDNTNKFQATQAVAISPQTLASQTSVHDPSFAIAAAAAAASIPQPSAAHPRVAQILGVNQRYYFPLILCRGLSLGPSILGLSKCAYALWEAAAETTGGCSVVELWLAALWCSLSAVVSYLLINNLMARWLIFYTPAATIVRLFSVNAINAYITSWALTLIGENDSRMLFPAWIFVASILTIIYHATLRKLQTDRPFTPAMSLMALASFASMIVLLFENHICP
ncbi:N-glycosylation protein-domain-containing protein [Pyronema omphalodes]|nr:N-glycosylation protein-domain-containing protein [Pyronema omphalodes]